MLSAPSIFISYSTLDLEVAQKVRNLFEKRGHDALLLMLKQHMSDEAMMDFLRNEVQARDWVVLVDSQRAEQSNWVLLERAYAGILRKPIYHVNADCAGTSADPSAQDSCLGDQVNRISRRLRVFISSSHKDKDIPQQIADALREAGYELGSDAESPVSTDYQHTVQTAIDKALERGVMLPTFRSNTGSLRGVSESVREVDYRNHRTWPEVEGHRVPTHQEGSTGHGRADWKPTTPG